MILRVAQVPTTWHPGRSAMPPIRHDSCNVPGT